MQEVFGFDNVNAAFRHWFNFGQFEGRDCTCGKYIHRKLQETLTPLKSYFGLLMMLEVPNWDFEFRTEADHQFEINC